MPENITTGTLSVTHKPGSSEVTIEASLSGALLLDRRTNQWVAHCIQLDISSCGDTREGAMEAIKEAIELFFDSCVQQNTLMEALAELGWVCEDEQEVKECDSPSLSFDLPPAFIIDDIQKHGNDWSTKLRLG
jgi:predicted RNase H-like HicB family nuclease